MTGEVKVRISLTNVIDDGLMRRGRLSAEEVRIVEVEATADLGVLKERGRQSRLTAFLEEVSTRLVPMLAGGTAP